KGLGFRRGKSISKSPLYALLGRLHGRDLEERVQCWVEGVAAEIQGMGLTMVETEHAQGLDATRHPTVTIGNETPQESPQPESNPWHMLSAVLQRSATTLVRVPADGTTLEIPLAAVLRERLHLENQTAPDDAQLTPKAIAQAIAPQEKSTR
ncbi:MAG: hypothetical protein N2383_09160, partial [Caldilineales bacterium]|nr:hypothetical protein [Caldilineales bacterium]